MDKDRTQAVFKNIADKNIWKCPESISGPGSTLQATTNLRNGLPVLLRYFNIRTLVDAPCGDMHWMRLVDYPFEKFTGIDIVPSIIEKLKREIFPRSHYFQVGDICTDVLPQADALFCRDCLTHLSFEAIHKAVAQWKKAGFTYIIATTFTGWKENKDCAIGGWRPLNMEAAPFFWPPARAMMPENSNLPPPYDTKSIGLWSL